MLTLCLSGVTLVVPATVWSSWSFAPATLIPLLVAAAAYAYGLTLRPREDRAWPNAGLFAAGILLLAIALVSPLCRLAATLASAHMLQHVILVALAPPLLIVGAGGAVLAPLLPRRLRSLPFGALRNPTVAGALYGAAIWFWHVPLFYQAALTNVWVHLAMYVSLFGAALLFWSAIFAASRRAEQAGIAVLVLLATLVHTGMLGALLSLSRSAWYPIMSAGGLAFGLTPLEDQQLAGLIMWAPMGLVYLLAALAVVATALANLRAQTS